MLVAASIITASLAASAGLWFSQRRKWRRSWKALAPAVPDPKAAEATGYRRGAPSNDDATSRKALALLPASRRAMRFQSAVALAAAPVLATVFSVLPLPVLGLWGAAVGGVWGLALSAAMVRDDEQLLGLLAFPAVPLIFVNALTALAAGLVYVAARGALAVKNSASDDERERERLADPRYLVASREGRAAGIARHRSSGGTSDPTAATARDNSTVT